MIDLALADRPDVALRSCRQFAFRRRRPLVQVTSRLDPSEITLLQALPEALATRILESCSLGYFSAGEAIVGESDQTTDLFFLLEGRVAVKAFSDLGYQVSYIELSAGAMFGEFSAVDGAPRAANVEALTVVTVARLRRDVFRGFLEREAVLGLALSAHLVRRARALSERIFEFSTFPVAERVRLELLRVARDMGSRGDRVVIKPAPTHQEIAARISTHREAVSREISELVQRKIIISGRQTIEIVSLRALRQSFGNH
jgi:CRP/FNR family transcriptional regulator, cyclic AMP receptor protein